MFDQRAAHLFDHRRMVSGFDLVGLGHHHLKRHGGAVQQHHNLFIHRFDAMAGIHQHKGAAQGLTARQIAFQQPLPLFHDGQRRLGIAIAGQVHQIMRRPGGEIVDLLRAPRRVGGAGQRLAPGQRIDQAGFTDVGAPGKADLQPVGCGQAIHRHHAFDKFDRPGKQHAPGFAAKIIRLCGQRKFQFHASSSI